MRICRTAPRPGTGTAHCIHKEQAGLHDRSVPLMVSEKGENSYEADARNFLLNTTIAIGNAQEEFALPLRGRKRKLTRDDLIVYFGAERLGLN